MNATLLAEFRDPERLELALARVKEARHTALDALTPYPIEGLDREFGNGAAPIRPAMLAGGLGMAALALALQWYSAVIDYPINSGGRPLNSWPVFLLVPFEVGIFAAALCGVLAFLWSCGLPRLHDPIFAVPGIERATQDRYFLLTAVQEGDGRPDLRQLLEQAGAVVVTEVRQP
jgi:Protein of unknown function (DUF3341)